MKKLLFSVAIVATLCSCGNNAPREYYFMENEIRVHNNPEAEFDTLSYAIGMNLGLNMHVQQKDVGYITDIVCETIESEVMKEVVDLEFIKQNREKMKTFSTDYARPHITAKQKNMFNKMNNPEAADSIEVPELFGGEFTVESVSQQIGYDMGNHIREVSYPVNLHWVFKAMHDAENLNGSFSMTDTTMLLNPMVMTQTLRKYYTQDLIQINSERSRKWISDIASKSDVEQLVVGSDTLYYRIEKVGSSTMPEKLTDTIQITYEVFTSRGSLIESTAERALTVKKSIEQLQNDTEITDSLRNVRMAELNERLAKVEKPKMPIANLKLRGAQECLKLIGVDGEITIWMPASMAYGEQGNRSVQPNEAVIMNIHLYDVKEGSDKGIMPSRPGNPIVKTIPQGEAMKAGKPVSITPVPVKEATPIKK